MDKIETDRLEVTPTNAPKLAEWIAKRGGVAVWRSVDLSDPGCSMSTPALTDGGPTGKPHWKVDSKPERIITDASLIDVVTRKEVKRFRIAVRRGGQGLSMKLTDHSSRKLRMAVDKAGKGADYQFDYETQEAVVTVPDETVPLNEWLLSKVTFEQKEEVT